MAATRYVPFACALLILSAGAAVAADWFEGEGAVGLENRTPEEARSEALNLARADALARESLEIVGMTSHMMSVSDDAADDYDSFLRFTQQVSRGLILEEEILFDDLETLDVGGRKYRQWRVTLRARVESNLKDPDPGFVLDAELDRSVYRVGEYMSIELKASKDCWLTILNLYSNDRMYVVLPNNRITDNHLPADTQRIVPDPDGNILLPLGLTEGRSADQEAILIIATRDDIPFTQKRAASDESLLGMSDSLLRINNWLADIPADRRTQQLLSYRIVR